MADIQMPEGTHLAYTIYHETTWWHGIRRHDPRALPNDGHPCIQIAASAKGQGGGVKWEFSVVDRELYRDRPSLRLDIFDEGWEAFILLAPFFAKLASGEVKTLDDVRLVLDEMGAIDETERG